MAGEVSGESYWGGLARSYATLGSPLRPSGEDIRFMEEAVASWAARHPNNRVRTLLLGVTPDIALARWPEGSSLMALDWSMGMVRAVWPGNIAPQRQAVCGDWLALPCRESSIRIVLGDGSMNCVRYPEAARAVAAAVRCALGGDGILVLRCYVQPDVPESPEAVFADLCGGVIPSFHHFKLRLLMALQRSARHGIAVDHVYRYWASRNMDLDALAARTGWEKAAIEMIELYRGTNTVHFFPNMTEFRSVLLECFEEISVLTPSYYLGGRCPTFVLKPRCERRPFC